MEKRFAARGLAPAFTLFEILIVMVVVGLLATMTLPRFVRKAPAAEWSNILDEVNNLVNYARQEAIATQNIYRINFHVPRTGNHTITVELEKDNPEKPGQKLYEPIKSYYFTPTYELPESIAIQAVYHGKEEQLAQNKNHGYCYVIPNGLVQEVVVHLTKEEKGQTAKKTLKTAPFLGEFNLTDGFEKPGG